MSNAHKTNHRNGLRAIFNVASVVSLIVSGAACANGSVGGVAPEHSPQDRIVLAISGGISGLADTTVIQRSTGTLVRTSCLTLRGAANSCPGGAHMWRVSLSVAATDSLFRSVQTAEFLALTSEYDMSGTFVDGPAYDLRITTANGSRSIRWSDAPGVPAVLTTFLRGLQARTADR